MTPEPDDLNQSSFPHWPGDWPGRRFVDLDCLGDPGAWLEMELPSVEEVLSGGPQEDQAMAEYLADAYISMGQELAFPLPTDFDASPQEMREDALADFVGFIREWRERAEDAGTFKPKARCQKASFSTWNLLPTLGFAPDPSVHSDEMPGLSFDFGDVKVAAGRVMNLRLKEVVLFTGVLKGGRTVAEIRFEMPLYVESCDQGLAWIVWGLDQAADGHVFKPTIAVPWLEQGRQRRNTLPWERERVGYATCPHCSVEREWARVALKTLATQLAQVEDDTPVDFHFNGEVLTIRCEGHVTALPAQGDPWPQAYSIWAVSLRNLPKRLTQAQIEVSIWDSALAIGKRRFGRVIALER